MAGGLTDAEIAERLSITVGTVKTHLGSAQTRIAARNPWGGRLVGLAPRSGGAGVTERRRVALAAGRRATHPVASVSVRERARGTGSSWADGRQADPHRRIRTHP
ncbi:MULTISPECIES: LuxR C-terminal-related transcriptional regulator [unclassified Streptomyces]|uniref:LuxR C-terminal-related transcriptional regulator n=1 Tax=unclassified Streptomyces TaxID=2593676 RepID=UPI0021561908|nr:MULTISPECIES: LuxR C-terminal-related transcriptional regulator [unclassified Streptomyces]